MPIETTSRGGFPYPKPGSGQANNVPADLKALADRIAAVGALYIQVNYLADMPAAGVPGLLCNVLADGSIWHDDGTQWRRLPRMTDGRIVGLDNGVAATDAATVGQVPTLAAAVPAGRMRKTTAQNLPNLQSTGISFNQTTYLRGGVTASTGGLTVPVAGIYEVHAQASLETTSNAGIMHVSVTGSTYGSVVVARGDNAREGGVTTMSGSTEIPCAAGNRIGLTVFHSNDSTRPLAEPPYETALSVRWTGPQ